MKHPHFSRPYHHPMLSTRLIAVSLVLSLLLALALGACGRNPSSSNQSKAPTPPAPSARRIVVLSPAIAVMLKELGHEDEIVARHTWDLALSKKIPALGDQFDLDYEQLMTLNPTHVYTQYESAGIPDRLRTLGQQRGWHLEDYRLNTLQDIASALDDLYMDLGGAFKTDRDLDLKNLPLGASVPEFADSMPSDKLAAAWGDRGPAVRRAGRVLLVAQSESSAVLGPGSFHDQILVSLGATPAMTEGGPWMDLDAEDILRLAPDAIFIFAPRERGEADRWPAAEASWDDLVKRLGAIGELPIPAIINKHVVLIDHPLGLLPSPALGEIAEQMAEALEAWSE